MRNERIIYLIMKEDNYITAKQISEIMGISRKLVVQSIQEIKDELPEYGALLEVKKGRGYRIQIHDKTNFDAHFQIPLTQNMIKTQTSDSHSERVIFLCRKLLSQEKPITISSLAAQMYLSKGAIEEDLKQAYELLADYQLSVEAWQNKGLIVIGEEKNKRFAITDLIGVYYNFYLLKEVDPDYWRWIACENDEASKIRHLIYDVLQSCHIRIKDINVQRITAYLIVMRHRCSAWYPLYLTDEEKVEMRTWPEIQYVHLLFDQLVKENPDFCVDEDERGIVAQLLRISQETAGTSGFLSSPELCSRGYQVIHAIEEHPVNPWIRMLITIETLHGALINLICKALFRKQWNLPENGHFINQITAIVVLNSPICYYAACKLATLVKEEIHYSFSVEEITKLVQIIYHECEQIEIPHRQLKMLTHCENGMDMAELMIQRWNRLFGDFIESNQAVELYEVRELARKNYDCILLLTLDFAYKETIPPFFTAFIPDKDDISQFINDYILPCYELEFYLPDKEKISLHEHSAFKSEAQFIHQLAYKVCLQIKEGKLLEKQLKQDFLSSFLVLNEEVIVLLGDQEIVKKEIFQIHRFKHAIRWKGRTVKTICFAVLALDNPVRMKLLEILCRKLSAGRILSRYEVKSKALIEAMEHAVRAELKINLIR